MYKYIQPFLLGVTLSIIGTVVFYKHFAKPCKGSVKHEIVRSNITSLPSPYNVDNNQLNINNRQAVIDSLISQFDPYRKDGIKLSVIENLSNIPNDQKLHLEVGRIQVVDNKVYGTMDHAPQNHVLTYRFNALTSALNRALKTHKINNVDFIIFLGDGVPNIYPELVINTPTFLVSKKLDSIYEKDKLLMPDSYIIDKNWPNLTQSIEAASQENVWESKIPKIFWRGSTTGGSYNLENYDKLPRLSLMMLSRSFPDLIDARCTNFVQFSEDTSGQDLLKVMHILFGETPSVKEADHLKYKYLISIDGNTSAWARVPWILLSNSVLIKQDANSEQFFYKALKPFVHYVPVAQDLSDIFEKLRWLQDNDEQAKIIAENGTKFARENLLSDHFEEYLAIILNEYSSLQRFTVDTPIFPLIEAE